MFFFFFFPLSASGRRHPERFHSAPSCEWLSCCKRLQGLCWIASAAAGFFSSVSVSVRRDDGWTRAACRRRPTKSPRVSVWRTKEEDDGERTRRNRGWLLITWRGVGFSVKVFFFFLEQISLYKCSSTILQFHQNGRSPSFTSFACSVPSQMCDRSSRERLSLQKAANRGLTGLFLLSCSTAVQLFNKTSHKLVCNWKQMQPLCFSWKVKGAFHESICLWTRCFILKAKL